MYSMCKPIMERIILGKMKRADTFEIKYANNIPYISIPGAAAIEGMHAYHSRKILYDVLKMWNINVNYNIVGTSYASIQVNNVSVLDIYHNYVGDDKKLFSIEITNWHKISNKSVIWMGELGNYWQIYTFGDLKMYDYDDNTNVLDRLMLFLLVDSWGFLLKIKERIEASSPQTRQFFNIVQIAISSDLKKYMSIIELNFMFQLNSDIVSIILDLWIRVVMRELVY